MPRSATYFVGARRLDRVLGIIRDGMRPLIAMDKEIRPETVDKQLREKFAGKSPLNVADLADVGFAFDRSVAMFSSGHLPTLVFPVADRTKVEGWLGEVAKEPAPKSEQRRNVKVTTWGEDGEQIAWAFVGDWLFVRVMPSGTAWIEEILDARGGLATAPDLAWAMRAAPRFGDAVVLFRSGAFADALASRKACAPSVKLFKDAVGRIALSIGSTDGRLDVDGLIEVPKPARDAIVKHSAPAGGSKLAAARAGSSLWLAIGLDPQFIQGYGKAEEKPDGEDKPEANGEGDDSDCAMLSEPLEAVQGLGDVANTYPEVTAVRVGIRTIEEQKRGVFDLAAFAVVHARDEGAAGKFVDKRLPRAKFSDTLRNEKQGAVVRLAIGANVTAPPADDPPAASAARELFSFEFRPDKLADMQPLAEVFRALGSNRAQSMRRVNFLSRFKRLAMALTIETDGIRVAGGFELR